jgi:hypothetical protein
MVTKTPDAMQSVPRPPSQAVISLTSSDPEKTSEQEFVRTFVAMNAGWDLKPEDLEQLAHNEYQQMKKAKHVNGPVKAVLRLQTTSVR